MQLLDLPSEILRLIVDQVYDPWTPTLNFREPLVSEPSVWWHIYGTPPAALLTTCSTLSQLAKEAEKTSFSGTFHLEDISQFEDYEIFCRTPRFEWLRMNVRVVKVSDSRRNPCRWRLQPLCWTGSDDLPFPQLQRIELNCRFPSLFALHNVPSLTEFLSGSDGRLEKQMDYRRTFFFSDERFLLKTLRSGLPVTVVREMGVREKTERCQAVVCYALHLGRSLTDIRCRSSLLTILQTRMTSLCLIGTASSGGLRLS